MARLLIKAFAAAAVAGLVACAQPAVAPAGGGGDDDLGFWTVTFDSNGGSKVPSLSVPKSPPSTVDRPADPTKTENSFTGWYTDVEKPETRYDFGRTVTSNLKLVAGWEHSDGNFKVTNKTEWDEAVASINKAPGAEGARKNYAIELEGSFGLPGSLLPTFDAGYIKVTIKGAATRKLSLLNAGYLLYAAHDQTVQANDITLVGSRSNNLALVRADGGEFVLNGATLMGNINTSVTGGGAYVSGGGKLVVAGTVSDNGVTGSNAKGGGVFVDGGTVVIEAGGVIKGNSATSSGGGFAASGVEAAVEMSGGEISANTGGFGAYLEGGAQFTMTGGTIEKNPGGGVTVTGTGTKDGDPVPTLFTMGGEDTKEDAVLKITANCPATPGANGRGVVAAAGAKVVLKKGEISFHKMTGAGSGGTGVSILSSAFEMTGGTITGNESSFDTGLILSTGSTGTMSGGSISGNIGGSVAAVCVTEGSLFTLSGDARIEGNTANSNGALYISGKSAGKSAVVMEGNAVIANNTMKGSKEGAGVKINDYSTFTMRENATISGNGFKDAAIGGQGGGVYLGTDTSVFNMEGGVITGKAEEGWTGYVSSGGGVYQHKGTVIMSGNAKITGNRAGSGGGINLNAGTFVLGGNAEISGNICDIVGGAFVGGGTFIMKENAVISGNDCNAAENTGQNAGGIYLVNGAANAYFLGGTISSNTAKGLKVGGGVHNYNNTATVRIQNIKIHGNDAPGKLPNTVAPANTENFDAFKGVAAYGTAGDITISATGVATVPWSPIGSVESRSTKTTLYVVDGVKQDYDPADDPVTVSWDGLKADGSEETTTTTLTLTFDQAIPGLAMGDFSFGGDDNIGDGINATNLTNVDGVYTLTIEGVAKAGDLTVTPTKKGYTITPPNKIVAIFYKAAE